MRAWHLLVVAALAGCQSYTLATELPPASPATGLPPLSPTLRVDAQPGGGRTAEEWRQLLRDEVLSGGWVGGETGPLLHVHATRRVIPDRASEALHVLTVACYPGHATVLIRVSAVVHHAAGMAGLATASVEVDRAASLLLIFYPPAWGLEPGADLLAEAVRSATRTACARLQRALSQVGGAAAPSPAIEPGREAVGAPAAVCPSCGEPVEPAWIACPRCATSLKD